MSDAYGVDFWFNNEMSVLERIPTEDNVGTFKDEPVEVASGIRCRIRRLNGFERQKYGKIGKESTHRLYCHPLSFTLDPEYHQIRVKGVVFDITVADNPHEEDEFLQINLTQRT